MDRLAGIRLAYLLYFLSLSSQNPDIQRELCHLSRAQTAHLLSVLASNVQVGEAMRPVLDFGAAGIARQTDLSEREVVDTLKIIFEARELLPSIVRAFRKADVNVTELSLAYRGNERTLNAIFRMP